MTEIQPELEAAELIDERPDERLDTTRLGPYLRAHLEGVTYLSMPSSGGHLRDSGKYQDGWFFGHVLATISSDHVAFSVKRMQAPATTSRRNAPAPDPCVRGQSGTPGCG